MIDALGGQTAAIGVEKPLTYVVIAPTSVHNLRVTEEAQDFVGTPRFEVRTKIGEGGMGVVYEAFDHERHMVVALKTLARVSPAAIYRLKQEFRALANLHHPNLVELYDLAHVGDRWLFTMERVHGVELMRYLRPDDDRTSITDTVTVSGGLDWLDDEASSDDEGEPSAAFEETRLRAVLVQLAQCLRAIHDTGRVHRDLKPSNVLVRESGEVVLLDFGLVTRLDRDDLASMQSTIVGTPAYMAPEQATHETPTPAVDWYAVGVILYEAMTGVRPFGGSMVQLLTSKQTSEPPAPSSLVRGLPEDLNALAVDLLRREPSERPTGDEVLRRLARLDHEHDATMVPSRRRKLVGRDRELEELGQFFEHRGGCAHVVELRSAPGLGRTALLRTFLANLGSDAVVLAGRCREQEAVPYKAFDAVIDSLSRYLRHRDQDEVRRMLPPSISALARIFPVLERVPAVAEMRASLPEAADVHTFRRHAFGALRTALAALAQEAPVLLVIDDIHWGDSDSAALLEQLLMPPSPPVLLVMSFRSSEGESPLVHAISQEAFRQRLNATWSSMDLLPLETRDAAKLAATLVSRDEPLIERLAAESHGNPLLLVELARHAVSQAGDALRLEDILEQRILALPLGSRSLLEVLAIGAAPLELEVATSAASRDTDSGPIARVVSALSTQHLVRSSWYRGRARLDVFNDHIRRAVIRTLPPEGQRSAHARLARALAESDAPPELAAHHQEHAGETALAAAGMTLAGENAMQSLAFHRAATLFGRAHALLREGDRGGLEERWADALAASGRSPEAARLYMSAAGSDKTTRDALDLQRLAAEHLMRSGHIDEGLEAVKAVLGAVGLSLPATPRRALVDVVVQRTRLRIRGLEAKPAAELSDKERREMDACWTVAVGLSMADTIVGADFHARHLRLALDSGDHRRVARSLALEAAHVGSTGLDRQERAVELLDEVDALARHLEDPRAFALGKLMRGCTALFMGQWRKVVKLTDQSLAIFEDQCIDAAWEIASARRFNHVALYYLGNINELCTRVPVAIADARSRGDRFAESCAASGSAVVVWLADDDVAGAQAFLREEPARWGKSRFALQHLLALQGMTLTSLYAGDGAAAHARLGDEWPRMKASMILRVQLLKHTMLTLRARCAVAAGPQHFDDALRDAKQVAREGLSSSRGLATLIQAGVAARREPQRAVALYQEAMQLLEEAQMRLHAAAAETRLGELLGGSAGAFHTERARGFMERRHIRKPERFVTMLAP